MDTYRIAIPVRLPALGVYAAGRRTFFAASRS
ncbi:MAG: hypothetical protein JWQ95_4961 [Sphaerisporangium sp.]|jgi:hypothetical protein|nr:hypothetical protein [Sphaerisporangium sp.]